jgi:Met-zincin/Domain of unknown function (DUF5117)/Domain of unknown function (DUF5118)
MSYMLMPSFSSRRIQCLLALVGASAIISGCASSMAQSSNTATSTKTPVAVASVVAPPADAASAPKVAASGASSGGAAAGAPKPFAEVIKEAKEHKGLFTLYSKDEKVWLELQPEQLEKLYFLQVNLNQGLSSSYLAARRMFKGEAVVFRKVGQSIQVIARNFRNMALAGTPQALAVAQNTSDSLVGSATIASAPHPTRKSLLIELNGILLSDLTGLTTQFDAAYRTGYALDSRNSYFDEIKAKPDAAILTSKLHFNVAKLPAPPVPNPAGPPPNPAALPQPQQDSPDPRSFFIGQYITLSALPEQPMKTRAADGRVGHFNSPRWDFGNERDDQPRRWLVNRWRLEKADPSAALSEPKKPITYWLDKNIPVEYRDTVRAGILEWNKAFERIGFKSAIKVEQQTDDADFDTDDTHHASIRWVLDHSEGALGVGPSVMDPRSGEILDADIGITHGWARLPRYMTRYQFPQPSANVGNTAHTHEGEYCTYNHDAMDQAYFAMDLIGLRGGLEPGSPEADTIVKATLKDVITHEVGHTLGLRHNFRASTIHPLSKLKDAAYTKQYGLSGSVMDYNGWNISLDNEPQGEYVMSTLGAYDYWAIEYAYKDLGDIKPVDERAALAAIATKGSTQPELAYGTDEEVMGDGDGMDPSVNQRDLGSDPLAYAERRVKLSRELLQRLQTRGVQPGESYGVIHQSFRSATRQIGAAMDLAAKHVGGVTYVRDYGGSNRAPLTPLSAAEQRRALKLLNDNLFSRDGLAVPAALAARLTPDALERGYTPPSDAAPEEAWLGFQKAALDRLFSDKVAGRINQAPAKLAQGADALRLSEVYDSVQTSVWAELKTGQDINTERRALQREHLRRITASLLKPSGNGANSGNADAKALHRLNAKELLAQLQRAQGSGGAGKLSREARAHMAESESLLQEALQAKMTRPS